MRIVGILCILFLATYPDSAYAYVDPGAGNTILALIMGGLSGLVVVYHLIGARIRRFLAGKRKSDDTQ